MITNCDDIVKEYDLVDKAVVMAMPIQMKRRGRNILVVSGFMVEDWKVESGKTPFHFGT